MEGKMYKHFRNQSNFVIPMDSKRRWGNNAIYGGIFVLQDFDFYIRILDAYFACSQSSLIRNHKNDIHHRVTTQATPIYFNTLEQLATLQYREGEPIKVQTYMGNVHHPNISQRLNKTVSYRLIDGIDAENFTQLFREVTHESITGSL